MAGKWDTSTKRLVSTHPADFIRWLIPGAQFTGAVEARSLNFNNREIEADNLHQLTLNGIVCMIHIEFQSYADEQMAERMWEYNALATSTYKCPTDSFVIYLKRCKVPKPHFTWKFPTGKRIHEFQFEVIKLWEVPFEVLKDAGMMGLLPLMVLAKGGKNRTVVEEAITAIQTVEDENARDLLSLTYIFAALALVKEADQHWLKRRFAMFEDALKDSWAYQEIWQEGEQVGEQRGLQKGEQIGLQKGIQQGLRKGLRLQRQMLVSLVRKNFPDIVEMAKERGKAIDRLDVLQDMILQLLNAETEEEARRILSQ
ncbi:MAG: hypothetical protein ABI406_02265 [Ktedonobacteraceae bacterium]